MQEMTPQELEEEQENERNNGCCECGELSHGCNDCPVFDGMPELAESRGWWHTPDPEGVFK